MEFREEARGSRLLCTVPSKQVITGSSPVSRSTKLDTQNKAIISSLLITRMQLNELAALDKKVQKIKQTLGSTNTPVL